MQFVQSPPGDDPIVVESFFAASPARVFNAWTDPDIIMKWFGIEPNSLHSADIDLRPGGAWQFLHSKTAEQTMGFEGAYAEVEPDERLVFSWSHVITKADGAREATPESRIEVTFTPKGSGTMVRLVHSAVRTEDARRGIGGGWETSFGSLRDLLAE